MRIDPITEEVLDNGQETRHDEVVPPRPEPRKASAETKLRSFANAMQAQFKGTRRGSLLKVPQDVVRPCGCEASVMLRKKHGRVKCMTCREEFDTQRTGAPYIDNWEPTPSASPLEGGE